MGQGLAGKLSAVYAYSWLIGFNGQAFGVPNPTVLNVYGILGGLTVVGIMTASATKWLGFGIVGLVVALFAGYVALILRNPARAPHDLVAGTYLVPK